VRPSYSRLDDLRAGARLLAGLPAFLRRPIGVPEAETLIRRRLAERDSGFLGLLRRAVYPYPESPYRRLLARAGCEYGDVVRLVEREGVEGALGFLYRAGVYVTVSELKGRCAIVRGRETIHATAADFRNPTTVGHVSVRTSGSRGGSTPMGIDLAFLQDEAVNRIVTLAARGGRDWRLAYWDVPGGALRWILAYAKGGTAPARWFSPVDPGAPGLDPRYRWSTRVTRWGGRLAGVRLPAPRHVPASDPLPVVRWMAEVLRSGHVPFLLTYSSPAVRLARAAVDAGLSLAGAHVSLDGEPITAARIRVVRASGADPIPMYVTTETGRAAEGCLAPAAPDDVHLFHDLYALIQPGPGHTEATLTATSLLMTALRPNAPLVLVNASLGDQAVAVERACGCPLERLGWRTHLHTIRSFEKLTAGGMTFLDTDVIRVLEEVLPARFGGAPTDYQLVEGSGSDGQACLRLLVHPVVGSLDAEAVSRTFLAAIGGGSGANRIMGLVWRDAGLLRVERRPPLATGSGKILHVQVDEGRL
jgi:hypothetical protein